MKLSISSRVFQENFYKGQKNIEEEAGDKGQRKRGRGGRFGDHAQRGGGGKFGGSNYQAAQNENSSPEDMRRRRSGQQREEGVDQPARAAEEKDQRRARDGEYVKKTCREREAAEHFGDRVSRESGAEEREKEERGRRRPVET